ncbi:unnamed protein product [Cyprideis torosa]|uniref:Uncharacterized protein n=1 Tax=Cyprideis torosa TaxID=163714 RepID=A0A7R8W017_9CRUS|nr:unnamed protein product [Cyprideis torosa]CAG0879282.1 unnamed protein product [Cyprideis torosa]
MGVRVPRMTPLSNGDGECCDQNPVMVCHCASSDRRTVERSCVAPVPTFLSRVFVIILTICTTVHSINPNLPEESPPPTAESKNLANESLSMRGKPVEDPLAFDDRGMEYIYSATSQFLTLIMPGPQTLPQEVVDHMNFREIELSDAVSWLNDYTKTHYEPILRFYLNPVVMVIVGVVLTIVFTFSGILYFFCRCCCRTCGKRTQHDADVPEKRGDACRRLLLNFLLTAVTIIMAPSHDPCLIHALDEFEETFCDDRSSHLIMLPALIRVRSALLSASTLLVNNSAACLMMPLSCCVRVLAETSVARPPVGRRAEEYRSSRFGSVVALMNTAYTKKGLYQLPPQTMALLDEIEGDSNTMIQDWPADAMNGRWVSCLRRDYADRYCRLNGLHELRLRSRPLTVPSPTQDLPDSGQNSGMSVRVHIRIFDSPLLELLVPPEMPKDVVRPAPLHLPYVEKELKDPEPEDVALKTALPDSVKKLRMARKSGTKQQRRAELVTWS